MNELSRLDKYLLVPARKLTLSVVEHRIHHGHQILEVLDRMNDSLLNWTTKNGLEESSSQSWMYEMNRRD